ncbi:B-cell lymphoma/leukemia 11A-like [Amphibalanus amphitrite]|uniref:B-cell lymphoma/leukemia 11A-like n=1 Tax=Amphibalanus amphitrite TaxID=1232801 RepID=UPI001C90C863|nr:B-cell lymphoma/leukemia 11A-like [Amphibalanus amphitrite]
MRVKMPPSVRIVQDIQPDRGMQLLHREICCQGGSDSEPTKDAMTCRVCQRDFDLPDFIRLIQQWALSCSADPSVAPDQHLTRLALPGAEGGDDLEAQRRLAASLLRHLTPSVRDRENSECREQSPTPSTASSGSSSEKKEGTKSEEREEERRKSSVVDVGANTNESGPWSYVCFTCKEPHSSAWALVRHVQERHQVKIYEDNATNLHRSTTSSPAPATSTEKMSDEVPSRTEGSPSPSDDAPKPCSPLPGPCSPSISVSSPAQSSISPECDSRSESPSPPPAAQACSSEGAVFPRGGNASAPGEDSAEHVTSFPSVDEPQPIVREATSPPRLQSDLSSRPSPIPVPVRPTSRDFRVENILSERFRFNSLTEDISRTLQPPSSDSLSTDAEPLMKRARQSSPPTNLSAVTTSPATSRDRPRACEFCHKEFRFQSNLVVHRRIHTGEKPYRCRICSHACTQSSKLKRHMKTHLNELDRAAAAAAAAEELREDASTLDEEEAEERAKDERESGEQDVDAPEDQPEDLSTRRTTTRKTPSPAPAPPTAAKPSLVGELMDKFGLSSINAYRDAYRQALQESGKENATDKTSSHNVATSLPLHPSSVPMPSVSSPSISTLEQARRLRQELEAGPLRGMWLPPLPLPSPLGLPPSLPPALLRHAKAAESALAASAELGLSGFRPGSLDSFKLPGGVDAYKLPTGLDAYKLPGSLDGYKIPTRQDSLKPPTTTEPFGLKPPSVAAATLGLTRRQRRDTCEYCGKVFKNGSNLTVHKRSHTGEKPYRCRMCNYACAQSSKLTRHMKTHGRMGKDVFQCRFCGMPFSVASTLEKHMRKCVVSKASKASFMPSVLPGQS